MPERLTLLIISAVAGLTCVAVSAIVLIAIFRPGDNTGTISSILGAVAPTVGVLLLILQAQKVARSTTEQLTDMRMESESRAEKVKKEVKAAAEVAAEVAAKVKDVSDSVDRNTLEVMASHTAKIDEIRALVNGERDKNVKRIMELETALAEAKRRGGGI